MTHSSYYLGDITLQSGKVIHDAEIAYKTYGELNDTKDNVILYPTWYSGFISDNEWLIGEGMTLDPKKYFIIIVCLFGNGQSTSPSNYKKGEGWHNFTLYDNVVQQHRLIVEHFNIQKIQLVVGWSMGAMQTYQWACLYPEMVERIAPFCGAARTSPHNYVFLEGPKSALKLSHHSSHSSDTSQNDKYIRAFARIYAGWGFTQQFYKEEEWRSLGFKSLKEFLEGFWESFFLKRDKDNLLALIWTWQHSDISKNEVFNDDFVKALSSITAKTLILSPENDLYFPKEDNEEELQYIRHGRMVIIPGNWGHFAGGGLNKKDIHFIDNHLKRLLAE